MQFYFYNTNSKNLSHFETKNNIVPSMKWTHKGILFLYNKLKSVGIVPVMENTPRREA